MTLDIAYKKTQYPKVFLRGFYPLGTFRGIYVFWTVWGIFFWLREPVRLLAWEGSFIRCFTGSEAEYTLKSELYTLADCGENRITDMNNVQLAPCLFGRFLYTKKFFKNFYSYPNISLSLFGRYNGKGKGVCLCHVTTGEEVNSYEETFLPWWTDNQASLWPPVPDVAERWSD